MKIKSQLNLFVDLVLFVILIPVFIARGNIHEVLGYLFGILLLVHLVLHAKQIFALIQARFPLPKIRSIAVSVFCILCIATTIWSLGQSKKGREGKGFEGKPSISYEQLENNEGWDD
jgi:hypothetical protein